MRLPERPFIEIFVNLNVCLMKCLRFKGIAYIIVDGPKDIAVDTLAHVLAKSDHLLSGRKVRIEIYQVIYSVLN